MKTVLLTGAAGFIGHKTAEKLIEKGYEVIGVDNLNDYYDITLKNYRVENLKKLNGFTFYPIDIEDKKKLKIIFDKHKFDIVYNLAARAGVRYSMENPDIYFSTNVQGSLNLLELVREKDIKKYVLASTSSLYAGQIMPFVESLEVNTPISPYAASKKSAEMIAYTYHYLYGVDVSIVRYFTVYGPHSRPDMAQFRFMKWIDTGETIKVFGDGSQARDFTYIDDIAEGTILAGEKSLGFDIINLGGGNNPISISNMISILGKLLGKDAKIESLPFHKADMKETWADITKAKKLLNWQPKVSFEEGLERSVKAYRDEIEITKDIKL